jgi:hypothetical protein
MPEIDDSVVIRGELAFAADALVMAALNLNDGDRTQARVCVERAIVNLNVALDILRPV